MTRVLRGLGLAVLFLSAATSVLAQTPAPQRPAAPANRAPAPAPANQGRLLVTVVDQTNAVLPTATVTIVGIEDATRQKAIDPITATEQGLAVAGGLVLGRYSVEAEFPGFEKNIVKDTRVRAGDNKLTITLALEKMSDSATVSQDAVLAAADPHGSSFGTALTRDQIDALSDDPDTLSQQLSDLGGPGATIRVDSFEGGQLPPKSQIKSIHVTRDGFAAENHSSGQIFVEIITQPGVGALRGGLNTRLRDGSFSGRNQITGSTPPEMTENIGLNIGGSLIHQRASFSLQLNGTSQYVKPILNVALPTGEQASVLGQKQQFDNMNFYGALDYAVTKDQTLRLSYSQFSNTNTNQGIGAYDLPERAFSNDSQTYQLRVQEVGPIGRRFFINTRLNLSISNSDSVSATEAPTIRVNDQFTSGGAQQAGGRHGDQFTLASDLDYIRGIHSVRMGVNLDGGWYRSNDISNYLGTYTFASAEDYAAGTPVSYTQRIGDPTVSYFALQSGVYLQDDIRVRKNLTLSPGVRYEIQAHLKDTNAIGPRFGVTWSPFKNGKTSLRGSAGIFYDWLIPNTYEQTLRVDGLHQQEINIINPSYPNVNLSSGVIPPGNKYVLDPNLHFMHYRRVSAGVDQQINQKLRISSTYSYTLGDGLWRGKDLNAPVNGVRPNPAFADIVQVTPDAGSYQHQLITSLQLNMAGNAPPPMPGSGPRFDGKRFSFNASYTLGKFENNTDNRFSLPPTGDPALEWGPAPGDVRHRVNASLSSSQIKNINASLNFNASTGTPYSIQTGFDDNGDGTFNDRPVGVGRNTERTSGQWTLNGFFTYTFVFGRATVAVPQGIGVNFGPGGAPPVITNFAAAAPPRYRLQVGLQVNNITNHANYGGYSGTLTSPYFEQPTLVFNPRKIDVIMSLNF